MASLNHPNIVKFFSSLDYMNHVDFVMEYPAFGNVGDHLQTTCGLSKEKLGELVAKQILRALDYLHQASMIYRDVKTENILVLNYTQLVVKLADFGLCAMAGSRAGCVSKASIPFKSPQDTTTPL